MVTLSSLRGSALKSYLQTLNARYQWNKFSSDSQSEDDVPSSVTKRKHATSNRKSILQTPDRSVRIANTSTINKDENSPILMTATKTKGKSKFVICDTSSDESTGQIGDNAENELNSISSCMSRSRAEKTSPKDHMLHHAARDSWEDDYDLANNCVMEYVPTPKPLRQNTKVTTPVRNSKSKQITSSVDVSTPLTSLCREVSAPSTEARVAKSLFRRDRDMLTRKYFERFNADIFDNRLPPDLPVNWNKRLLTTAGITKLKLASSSRRRSNSNASSGSAGSVSDGSATEKRGKSPGIGPSAVQRTAVIDLSEKVCDDDKRLQTTLLHEMCHAAAWLLDGERKPPHGPAFWRFANLANRRRPELGEVTTCHNYSIHKPYKFRCTNSECEIEYSRHSKSIDIDRHRCGLCRSALAYEGKFSADGVKTSHVASGFSLFVKEHYMQLKMSKCDSGVTKTHQQIMLELSGLYHRQRAEESSNANADSLVSQLEHLTLQNEQKHIVNLA